MKVMEEPRKLNMKIIKHTLFLNSEDFKGKTKLKLAKY